MSTSLKRVESTHCEELDSVETAPCEVNQEPPRHALRSRHANSFISRSRCVHEQSVKSKYSTRNALSAQST
eukprot:342295-Lingulodinium_polyedra.AAC.1